jgi:hypothetical protein
MIKRGVCASGECVCVRNDMQLFVCLFVNVVYVNMRTRANVV